MEAELYRRYGTRVYFLALRETGSAQDADEVRTETFLRLAQPMRNGQSRSPAELSALVVDVARSVVLDLLARRRGFSTAAPADGADLTVPSPEGAFVDPDVQQTVAALLAELGARDRSVLRMVFFEDLQTPDIARRLGIAAERVRLVRSRALKRFQETHHPKKSAHS